MFLLQKRRKNSHIRKKWKKFENKKFKVKNGKTQYFRLCFKNIYENIKFIWFFTFFFGKLFKSFFWCWNFSLRMSRKKQENVATTKLELWRSSFPFYPTVICEVFHIGKLA